MDIMGGKIVCVSIQNQGSKFNLFLELPIEKHPPIIIPQIYANALVVPLKTGIRKVLVVDDNCANVFVVKSMLLKLKVDRDEAHNGQEAVEMYKCVKYALILMDINMPVMNEYDATIQIRQIAKLDGYSVSIVATSAQDKPMQNIEEIGFSCWIVKPVTFDRLKGLLYSNNLQ